MTIGFLTDTDGMNEKDFEMFMQRCTDGKGFTKRELEEMAHAGKIRLEYHSKNNS